MELALEVGRTPKQGADLWVLGIAETEIAKNGSPKLSTAIAALDAEWGGVVAALIASGDFSGKSGQQATVHPLGKGQPKRVVLLGLGAKVLPLDALRTLAGRAVRTGMAKGCKQVSLFLPARPGTQPKDRDAAQALGEGATLASYRYADHREKRDEDPKGAVTHFQVVLERCSDTRGAKAGLRDGGFLGDSQNIARDLSNDPPNELHPVALAKAAEKVAKEVGLKCKVLDVPAMKKLGMGGILAVGQGSKQPPRMVILEHNAPKRGARKKPTLCVVGKGITFDTGGISIKPAGAMHEMKHDMSGAATVVGVMRAAALLKVPHHVVGIIGAAENMPGGNAYRPGDIVKTMSGKTIEIINTDAEGRVVLSDALHYGVTNYEPRAMVDLATLTGACLVALGSWHTGLFTEDDKLAAELERAGITTGEPMWRLPLGGEHKKAMRGRVADLVNSGGRDAGASTAAGFLSAFVGDTSWAHLDIAGTGWGSKSTPIQPAGASGVGVRLLLQWLRDWKPGKAKSSRR